MKLQLIQQDDNFQCGAACLAMLTGMSVTEVEFKLGHPCAEEIPLPDGYDPLAMGTCDEEIQRFLFEWGFSASYFMTKEYLDRCSANVIYHRSLPRRHCFTSEELKRRILPDHRAVLCVPSLNDAAADHCIVWTGSMVLDPSRRRRYANLDGVVVLSAHVLTGDVVSTREI